MTTPRMVFVEQRQPHDPANGVNGDCFIACLATLLQVPYEQIPRIQDAGKEWWQVYTKWADKIGRVVVQHTAEKPPRGYSLAIGDSPRFPGVGHCVIALNGEVVFDPHPSKAGLTEIWSYETLERLNT